MAGEATDQILIELVVDDSQLVTSYDRLVELGLVDKKLAQTFKETNTELNKRSAVLSEVGGSMSVVSNESKKIKSTFDDVNKSVGNLTQSFVEGFEEGVIAELKKAGVSTKEFNDALKKAGSEGVKGTESLRTKMRELTNQMALLKSQGKDNTEQYKALTKEAGNLRDAMSDVNQEIQTAGSDTRVFDGLISAATGVAGAFSVAQGAAALFGGEDEELQKTLVKVQGALAVLNGLQAIQNVLQKESAAAILANSIATKAQSAAQAVLTFVIGTTTGALKAFRIALALTGVGLLVIGLIALVEAFHNTEDALETLNDDIEKNKLLLEGDLQAVRDRTEIETALAKQRGAAESELVRIRQNSLKSQIAAIDDTNVELAAQRDSLNKTSDAWFTLNAAIQGNNEERIKLTKAATLLEFDLTAAQKAEEKKRRDDAKAAAKEREALDKERLAKAKELRLAEFQDFKASLELQLLQVKKGSDEELELRKRLSLATLQIDLENDKLTQNQRKLAIQKFFQERIELEKTTAAEIRKSSLENIASDLNAELQAIDISAARKLELTESIIDVQAALELDAAGNNASKIEEINAKRDRAIKDARLQSIQSGLSEELDLYSAQNAQIIRQLQAVAANSNLPVQQRINAIKEVTKIQLEAIDLELKALNDEREQRLISDRQYLIEYAKLMAKKAEVTDTTEKGITDTVKQENEKRKEDDIRRAQTVIDTASQILSVYQAFVSNTNERESQAIQTKKDQLKDLKENGAITEKQYIARLKKVEQEEKKVRREQAERDKRVATFQALLAIPQAFLRGLTQGGPILGAIYAAIATANAIAVATRPLPKFARGSKFAPKGDAWIAEDRPEIIERKGRRALIKDKSIVRLEQGDIVYNAFETQKLLQKEVPIVSKELMTNTVNHGYTIDYDKLGKAVAAHFPRQKEFGLNIDENGFTKWTIDGLTRTKYHDKYFGKK